MPCWIVASGGEGKRIKDTAPGEVRYTLDPDKAKVVRRMFTMAINGDGATTIAKRFNKEGVPTLGRATMNGKAVRWSNVTIYHILTSRTTLGEYIPYRTDRKRPRGEPVIGYYPAVIDEATFYAAQAAIKTRAKSGRGRRGKHLNLLAGLLVDARDGGSMTYCHRGRSPATIVPAGVRHGKGTKWISVPADAMETALLTKLRELTPRDVAADTDSDAAKRLKEANAQIAKMDELITAWAEKMNDV